MSHLNNCNSRTNGERHYIATLSHGLVVFDIGSRFDSDFRDYRGIVHYFDPVTEFMERLKATPSGNTESFYNSFGFSDKEETIMYYPRYQSFLNRTVSCRHDDSANAIPLNVKKAVTYINENNIAKIDLIKIDTEGYELNVLKGFEDKLDIIDKIQFEYGGTYLDSGVKLIEVIDYLRSRGFTKFFYLIPNGLLPVTDFRDHYQYCNILCVR